MHLCYTQHPVSLVLASKMRKVSFVLASKMRKVSLVLESKMWKVSLVLASKMRKVSLVLASKMRKVSLVVWLVLASKMRKVSLVLASKIRKVSLILASKMRKVSLVLASKMWKVSLVLASKIWKGQPVSLRLHFSRALSPQKVTSFISPLCQDIWSSRDKFDRRFGLSGEYRNKNSSFGNGKEQLCSGIFVLIFLSHSVLIIMILFTGNWICWWGRFDYWTPYSF